MPFDSDVALLGTGVAALVAASHLLAEEKSVLVLNPDWDFFLENSELPLDPFLPSIQFSGSRKNAFDLQKLARSWPEHALAELRPDFPGAIEFWPAQDSGGYHDREAPHVRQRSWLWLAPTGEPTRWETLEEFYVEASDGGFNPVLLEGLSAGKRFPGFSAASGNFRGIQIPKLCDVDVSRYRNGLLEFVRERLGPERFVCAVSQIELIPEGLRFHTSSGPHTARIRESVLAFWTPRLSSWVQSLARKADSQVPVPRGVRLWEEWSLVAPRPVEIATVGIVDRSAIWAELEGAPGDDSPGSDRLAVLRAGPRIASDVLASPQGGMSWASSDSFSALEKICNGLLKWEEFVVRSMKPRAVFEWDSDVSEKISFLLRTTPSVQIIPGSDGPLTEVVRRARMVAASGGVK